MKKSHVFFGNQHIDSFYADGKKYTKFQIFKLKVKRFLTLTLKTILVLIVLATVVQIFRIYYPVEVQVFTQKEVLVETSVLYPVLDRIAKCESGGEHFGANGQVVVNGNTNSSVDIGKFQINVRVWGAKATEMGLDLTKEEDNTKFAKWLYANRGTEDWYSSKACWNK